MESPFIQSSSTLFNLGKWQTAGIVFTQKPKISIFTRQGRLLAPIHVKFDTAEGHVGPLGHVKFHTNRCTGVGKFPLFGKDSPLTNFYNC